MKLDLGDSIGTAYDLDEMIEFKLNLEDEFDTFDWVELSQFVLRLFYAVAYAAGDLDFVEDFNQYQSAVSAGFDEEVFSNFLLDYLWGECET